MRDLEATVGFGDMAVVDVDAVFVLVGAIRTLPGRDAAAAAAELNIGFLDPQGAETVLREEISTRVGTREARL